MKQIPRELEYKLRPSLLLEAAEFVESIPNERFNMDHWWLEDGQAFDDDRNEMYRVADGPCGCAIGNMIQEGLFGLTGDVLATPPEERALRRLPYQDRQATFARIGDIFGIPYQMAEFMFDQYAYPRASAITQAQVARRIRFIASEFGF